MAVVAQARDLPQAQLTFEKAHGLIMQKIVHPVPVELGATPDEPPRMDATATAFAIGQQVEAVLDHRGEQPRAPAAAVEHNGDPALANQVAYFTKQAGQGLG